MSDGRFSKDVEPALLARKDEFGEMGQVFDKLNRRMGELLRKIGSSSEQVAASRESDGGIGGSNREYDECGS